MKTEKGIVIARVCIICLIIFVLSVFIIGIPLPIKRIAYYESNPGLCNDNGQCFWNIFYSDKDPLYLQILSEWKCPNPNIPFRMALVSGAEIENLRIKLYWDVDYDQFAIQTIVGFKAKTKTGIYIYSVPNLPYGILQRIP
jgi:hypothetical protein